MGRVAAALGIPELAGPVLMATAAYALADVVVALRLRRTRGSPPERSPTGRPGAGIDAGTAVPASRTNTALLGLGATAMIVTQLVTVALMTMTPVHMREQGHGLGAATAGHLAARRGDVAVPGHRRPLVNRRPLIAAAGVTLLTAGLLAATAPPESVALLAIALVLLDLS